MKIISLECTDFRNIEKEKLVVCDNMNVICGENAQGKTNFLEALWLFTGAKSFRGAKDSEFIRFSKEKCSLKLEFIAEEIEKEAKIEIKEKRTAFLNQNKLKAVSNLAGSFNAIIFSPIDLRIVTDGPSARRKFLDAAICQLYPSYIEILKKYVRAVTQRNKIIKDYKYDSSLCVMLDVFEEEIAINGEKIINLRKRYIEKLNIFSQKIYNGISQGKEIFDISYICYCKENLRENLKNSRKEDMFSGVTGIGPHRDDLEFKINGISARSFGSQGQKRSIALSLKLGEAEVLKQNVGESPIFLLDDVMSELDPDRQSFILNHIEGMQAFITCCDESNIKNLKAGKVFNIREGKIV